MMFKPGEVALRRYRGTLGESQQLSLLVESCLEKHTSGAHWHHASGGWDHLGRESGAVSYRPLVVLDPESVRDAQRLAHEIGVPHPYAFDILHSLAARPTCSAYLNIFGDHGSHHSCSEPPEHDGPHRDGRAEWS